MLARKPSARVVLNRSAMSKVELALADGLHAVGQEIIDAAEPPDATPFGEGLVTSGGTLLYRDGRKLAGWGQDGRQPRKPRAVRVAHAGTQVIVGFGFPGRFQEMGTVNHPAQPFLTPAAQRVLPRATAIMATVVGARLRGMR